MGEKISIGKRKILCQNLDNQCKKLSGRMKKIVIHEKFEVKNWGGKWVKKFVTEKNFNCRKNAVKN